MTFGEFITGSIRTMDLKSEGISKAASTLWTSRVLPSVTVRAKFLDSENSRSCRAERVAYCDERAVCEAGHLPTPSCRLREAR